MAIARREGADGARCAQLALVHDVAETRTGDVHYLSRMYVERREDEALRDAVAGTSLESDVARAVGRVPRPGVAGGARRQGRRQPRLRPRADRDARPRADRLPAPDPRPRPRPGSTPTPRARSSTRSTPTTPTPGTRPRRTGWSRGTGATGTPRPERGARRRVRARPNAIRGIAVATCGARPRSVGPMAVQSDELRLPLGGAPASPSPSHVPAAAVAPVSAARRAWAATRRGLERHRKVVAVVGSLVAAGLLALVLAGHRDDFATALSRASVPACWRWPPSCRSSRCCRAPRRGTGRSRPRAGRSRGGRCTARRAWATSAAC